jgi:hypothetical protein
MKGFMQSFTKLPQHAGGGNLLRPQSSYNIRKQQTLSTPQITGSVSKHRKLVPSNPNNNNNPSRMMIQTQASTAFINNPPAPDSPYNGHSEMKGGFSVHSGSIGGAIAKPPKLR